MCGRSLTKEGAALDRNMEIYLSLSGEAQFLGSKCDTPPRNLTVDSNGVELSITITKPIAET